MTNTSLTTPNKSHLDPALFKKSIHGKSTDLYILTNRHGMEVAITNYGGALLSIMVPDRNGKFANVVLGHDHIDAVIDSPEPFLSTLIGRYGNRIAQGRFTLEGQTYELAINNGPNSLHGGPSGFHARVWDAEQPDRSTLILKYTSPDGEEGFPGNVHVEVCYQVTDENALSIRYSATTDRTTIINLTHHGFYNLSGIGTPTSPIDDYLLTINADHYIPIDRDSIPTGEICRVADTPMDFRTPQPVGSRINEPFEQLKLGAGYDHCYVLNKKQPGELTFATRCEDPQSGRVMEMYTTEPGVQLYTSNWLSGFEGAHGATFPARSAICFEAQHFPDTPNHAYFPSCILHPGETYTQQTQYVFSTKK